jgi:hypothetical protein
MKNIPYDTCATQETCTQSGREKRRGRNRRIRRKFIGETDVFLKRI